MSAIGRLGRYIEVIDKLPKEQKTVSSQELARLIGATSSTVRQDFHNYLSEKGKSRVGYDVKALRKTLVEIMGLNRETRIILIGSGCLAQALVSYREFGNINIKFPAFFDENKEMVGKTISGIPVYHISELKRFLVKNQDIKTAVLSVRADHAQQIAEHAVKCGIEAIWNFSPVLLHLEEDVVVHNEYIGESLYKLIYTMNQRPSKGGKQMELLVCVGTSCHQKGSEEVVKAFQTVIEREKLDKKITLKGSFCLGHCAKDGVTIQFDDKFYKTEYENAEKFFYSTLLPIVKD